MVVTVVACGYHARCRLGDISPEVLSAMSVRDKLCRDMLRQSYNGKSDPVIVEQYKKQRNYCNNLTQKTISDEFPLEFMNL